MCQRNFRSPWGSSLPPYPEAREDHLEHLQAANVLAALRGIGVRRCGSPVAPREQDLLVTELSNQLVNVVGDVVDVVAVRRLRRAAEPRRSGAMTV